MTTRERQIRYWMEQGLTREEAEGLLRYAEENSRDTQRFRRVIKPKAQSSPQDDPFPEWVGVLAGVGVLFAVALIDLLVFRRKPKRKKEAPQEWLV